VLPCVPKPLTCGNTKRGLFTVQDFVYDAENDSYTCPAGKRLTKGKARSDRSDNIGHYRNLTACSTFGLKRRCTPDGHKRLKRREPATVKGPKIVPSCSAKPLRLAQVHEADVKKI
jgi:hypothetical protein